MASFIHTVGAATSRLFTGVGRFALFSGAVIRATFTRPPPWDILGVQMVTVSVRALPLIFAVASFVGMNMALQGYNLFREIGGSSATGMFVGLAALRELGPIVVGSMVASKSGSDMAAQIATMRLKSQIDALEIMAIEPLWYLIAPRFLAMVLMLPFLVVISDVVLVGAATAVAALQLQMNGTLFLNDVFRFASFSDIVNGMIKGSAFGVLISLLSCYHGFFAHPSPEGVGTATNRAIVSVTSLAVIVNLILSQIMYG